MDNVYGASYLRGLLVKEGIDAQIRAFHYRSFSFFLNPLTKMELLVPVAKLKEAVQITQLALIEIV